MRLLRSQLEALLEGLSSRVCEGQLGIAGYQAEFDRALALAGWTIEELGAEIDRSWAGPVSARQLPKC